MLDLFLLLSAPPVVQPDNTASILVAVFGGLSLLGVGGGVGSIWYMRSTIRSLNATAEEKEVSTDMLLHKGQIEMYDRLWRELLDLRSRYDRLERYTLLCNAALRKNGIEPPSWPDIDRIGLD